MDFFVFLLERLHQMAARELFSIGKSTVTVSTVLVLTGGLSLLWLIAAYTEKWLLVRLAKVEAFSAVLKTRLALASRWLIMILGAFAILDVSDLDVTAVQMLAYLDSFLNLSIAHIGKTSITPWTIIYVVSLWLTLVIVTNRFQNWCTERLVSRSGVELGAGHAISVILKYAVVSIGFVVILQSAGVDLSALTVLAGALGLGLSFGLQNITSNVVSGLIVLVERPIKVGDRIEVSGVTGDVKNIALRATTIQTNDNIEIIVPNSEFISGNVVNWSHSSRDVRVSLPVGVSYNSDPELVQAILLGVAGAHGGVLDNPTPTVIFKGFSDNSLDFVLRVSTVRYITTPGILQSELNFAIFKEFKNKNIEIPYPQRDLHIRSAIGLNSLAVMDKASGTAVALSAD